MALPVQHRYAVGDSFSKHWNNRNGSVPVSTTRPQPTYTLTGSAAYGYWTDIGTRLGLPALQFRYRASDPNAIGDYAPEVRRNQLTGCKTTTGGIFVPAQGQTFAIGYRVRLGPNDQLGPAYWAGVNHTSFKASAQTGPTGWGRGNNGTTGRNYTEFNLNRGAILRRVAFPADWTDFIFYGLAQTAAGGGWLEGWQKPSTSSTWQNVVPRINNIDAYGEANQINQVTVGIYSASNLGSPLHDIDTYAINLFFAGTGTTALSEVQSAIGVLGSSSTPSTSLGTPLFNGDSATSHTVQFEAAASPTDPASTPAGSSFKDVADPAGLTGTAIRIRTVEADHITGTDPKTRTQGLSPSFIDVGETVCQIFLGYIPSSLPSAPSQAGGFFTMASLYGDPFGGSGTRSMQLGSKPSASTHSFFVKDQNNVTMWNVTVPCDRWWKLCLRHFHSSTGWLEIYFADSLANPFAIQTLLTGGTRRTYAIVDPAVNGTGANHFKVLNYHRYPWTEADALPGGVTEWFVKRHRAYTATSTTFLQDINALPDYTGADTTPTPTLTSPQTPANLRVLSVSSGTVQLTCDAVPNMLTGDRYQWYVDEGAPAYFETTGPSIFITAVAPGGAALANGTTYHFRVSSGGDLSRPDVGNERYSGYTDPPVPGTPTATPATPSVPTGLRVIGVGDRQVQLDWNDNPDPFGQYQVLRSGSIAGNITQTDAVVGSGLTSSEFTDSDPNLLNGNVYTYRVRAGGTGNQSAASGSVQAIPSSTTSVSFLGQLSDPFTARNSAVWTTLTGAVSFANDRLVLTPTATTRAQISTAAAYIVLPGDTVKLTGITPLQGSASADRLVLIVQLGATGATRVVHKITDQFLIRRHVQEGVGTTDAPDSIPYDPLMMDAIGMRFIDASTVEYFTEDAAGARTVWETRALPFALSGDPVAVTVNASLLAAGTVTAPASVEALNPPQQPSGTGASLDDAEEKRLLDNSLPTATNHTVRLVATTPTPTTNGVELSGGGYARQTVQFTGAVSTGAKRFTATVLFPAPTSNWVEIAGFEVWSTAATPTRKWFRPYDTNERRAVAVGQPAYRIPVETAFLLD